MSKNYSKYKERYLLLKNQYGGANINDHVFSKEGNYLGKIINIQGKTITLSDKTKGPLNTDDENKSWLIKNAKEDDYLYIIANDKYLGKILRWDYTNQRWVTKKLNGAEGYALPQRENVVWRIGPRINDVNDEPSESWSDWFSKKFIEAKNLASKVFYRAPAASTPASTSTPAPAPVTATSAELASSSTVSPSEEVQPQKFIYFVECSWLPVEGVFFYVIASTPKECADLIKKDLDQKHHQNVSEQVGKAKHLELKDASQESKIYNLK